VQELLERPQAPVEREAPRASWGAARWLEQATLILRKDLLLESRTGEVLTTSAFFALLVVIISSLAYYLGPETRTQVAAGVIWLAVAFATVLSLSRTWQREREEGAFDGLNTAPLMPSALFAGKASSLFLFLTAIEAVVIPAVALLFSVDLWSFGGGLLILAMVATPGIASSATVFGVMTVRTRARDLVLAIVLFPLLAPTLLCAVVATRELLGGVPFVELTDYLLLMGVFDVVFVAGGLGLFGTLAEE
jgi:heme exporter protein B